MSRIISHSYGGYPFRIRIADPLAERWYDQSLAYPELQFLQRHGLKEGGCVFNLGAHQGIVAMALARIVGPEGKVLAVEANTHNVSLIHENAYLNEITNITVSHAAVGAKDGNIEMAADLNERVALPDIHSETYLTRSLTINALVERYGRPNLIYMDIEGYEAHALEGASEILHSTDWFIEVHVPYLKEYEKSASEVVSRFLDAGYKLFFSKGGMSFGELTDLAEIPDSRFFLVCLKGLS